MLCSAPGALPALDVIGGFSGSVCAGFASLRGIATRFRAEERGVRAAAFDWMPRVLPGAFRSLPTPEQRLRCDLVFIGVHPTLDVIPSICPAGQHSTPKHRP